MSLIATGILTAGKLIGGGISKKRAKKKGEKAEKEIQAETAAQSKKLETAYAGQQRAATDLGNVYKGQTSISPETQYARNQSERATATAIDKATQAGSSAGEIMSSISKLTASGQNQSQKISAMEEGRRKQAQEAAGQQALQAAGIGLAGEQAQINLQDKSYAKIQNKQNQISDAAARNYDYFSGALGDLGSAALMTSMYGGGFDANGMPVGKDLGTAFGDELKGVKNLFKKKSKA